MKKLNSILFLILISFLWSIVFADLKIYRDIKNTVWYMSKMLFTTDWTSLSNIKVSIDATTGNINLSWDLRIWNNICLWWVCKSALDSLWSSNLTKVYYNWGNVWIWTSEAWYKLDISDNLTTAMIRIHQSDSTLRYAGIRLDRASNTEKWFIGMNDLSDNLIFRRTGTVNDLTIWTNWSLWLWMSPTSKFSIKSSWDWHWILLQANGNNNTVARLVQNNTDDGKLYLYSAGTIKVDLNGNGNTFLNWGNVWIWTSSPTEKLEVAWNLKVSNDIKWVVEHSFTTTNILAWWTQVYWIYSILWDKIVCVKIRYYTTDTGSQIWVWAWWAIADWPVDLNPADHWQIIWHCGAVDWSQWHSYPCSLIISWGKLYLTAYRDYIAKSVMINTCYMKN